jgi:ribose 5-phosphate isomerase A
MGFPVPVEVIPEARVQVTRQINGILEQFSPSVILREALRKAGPVITEHGNIILDVRFGLRTDPAAMEIELNKIPGVVENGFFTGKPPSVFIAHINGNIEKRGIL